MILLPSAIGDAPWLQGGSMALTLQLPKPSSEVSLLVLSRDRMFAMPEFWWSISLKLWQIMSSANGVILGNL